VIEWCVSECGNESCRYNTKGRKITCGASETLVYKRDNPKYGCIGWKEPKKAKPEPKKKKSPQKRPKK